MTRDSGSRRDQEKEAAERSEHVDEFYIDLEDIGMGDIEFSHARPLHIKIAQSQIYIGNKPVTFRAVSLEREAEYTQRITVFYVAKSDRTCIVLLRIGVEDNGNGRTFYVSQLGDLLDDVPRMVETAGFEFVSMKGDVFKDGLPSEYTAEHRDGDGDGDGSGNEWNEVPHA
jgi:hypothetical protein